MTDVEIWYTHNLAILRRVLSKVLSRGRKREDPGNEVGRELGFLYESYISLLNFVLYLSTCVRV